MFSPFSSQQGSNQSANSNMSSPSNPPRPASQAVYLYPVRESILDKLGHLLVTILAVLGILALIILSQECLPRLWPQMTGEHLEPGHDTIKMEPRPVGVEMTPKNFNKVVAFKAFLFTIRVMLVAFVGTAVLERITGKNLLGIRQKPSNEKEKAAADGCVASVGDPADEEGENIKEDFHLIENDGGSLEVGDEQRHSPNSASQIKPDSVESSVNHFNWKWSGPGTFANN